MSYFKKVLLLSTSIIWLWGCESSGNPDSVVSEEPTEEEQIIEEIETGSFKTAFLLTDAVSDDFESVIVDIKSPIVVTLDNGAANVPLPEDRPIRVDLLALDGLSEVLTSEVISAGTIQKITLTLANPEITLVDGTTIDSSGIDLTGNLEITLSTPVTIIENQGVTVQIDIDVANSVSIDVTGSGRPLFRPRGSAARIDQSEHPDGVEAKRVKGAVAKIPGILGNPKSFLLKHPDRKFFLPVDAREAEIFDFGKKVLVDALKEGQRVEVDGAITHEHILKARRIIMLPEDHRAIRGVVTGLDQQKFVLEFLNRQDQGADPISVTVNYNDDTAILLDVPSRITAPTLTSADLTHGQRVAVRGLMHGDTGTVNARVIVIEPERFRGFVAEEPNCTDGLIRVLYPFKEVRRLERAGVTLDHNTGIVEIDGATLTDLNDETMTCTDLNRGMAVSILGQLRPTTDGVRVKAFEVNEVALDHVAGKVISVEPVQEGERNVTVLILKVPTGEYGFEQPVEGGCTALEGFDCTHFRLRVVLSAFLHNPGNIAIGEGLINTNVSVAGFFSSKEIRTPSGEIRRVPFFLAVSLTGEL